MKKEMNKLCYEKPVWGKGYKDFDISSQGYIRGIGERGNNIPNGRRIK